MARAQIVFDEDAVVTAAVGDVRIARLRHDEGAFSECHRVPVGKRNGAVVAGARPFIRVFVLLRAVNVIRKLVVEIDMVKLPRRLIVVSAPRIAVVG